VPRVNVELASLSMIVEIYRNRVGPCTALITGNHLDGFDAPGSTRREVALTLDMNMRPLTALCVRAKLCVSLSLSFVCVSLSLFGAAAAQQLDRSLRYLSRSVKMGLCRKNLWMKIFLSQVEEK
jgi:hypothetical protein